MKKVFAYKSDLHGRYFWLGTSYDLQSCPFNTKDNPFMQTRFKNDMEDEELRHLRLINLEEG